MYNEAWDKAEKLMEERLGCSMREAREVRDALLAYETKFSTKAIYGEDEFPQIIERIKESNLSKMFIVEECIKVDDLIKNIDAEEVTKVYRMSKKEKTKLIKDIEYAKALWNLIKYSAIPLEAFWAMEQEVEDGEILTDEEQEAYDYMRNIAYVYLEETDEIKKYASIKKSVEQTL